MEFLRGLLGLRRHGRRVHDRALGSGCAQRLAETIEALRVGDPHGGVRGRGGVPEPVDTVDLIVWGLAAVALAGGVVSVLRQKPPEDLTRQIFPDEP